MTDTLRTSPARGSQLPQGWVIAAAFVGLPVWWLLGLGAFVWVLVAVPMGLWLYAQPRVAVPRGFGVWLLFLGWTIVSALQLHDTMGPALAFAYRLAIYTSCGILLLYVYNLPTTTLSNARIIRSLAILWMSGIGLGLLAQVAPTLNFHSPIEYIVPGLGNQAFLHSLVHPRLAQVHTFLGFPLARPSAPFTYTNEWGSYMALLSPVFLYWLFREARARERVVGQAFLAGSLIPIVLSANRGMWLSLCVGALYAAARIAARGRIRSLMNLIAVFAVLGLLVVATPLRGIVTDRLETGHSDGGRLQLYEASVEGIRDSPLIGHGGPVQDEARGANSPPVGTHGQAWLVAFSHGLPGFALFMGFLLWLLFVTRGGGPDDVRFWIHVAVFIGIFQTPFYSLLPAQLPLMFLLAGMVMRAERSRRLAQFGTAS